MARLSATMSGRSAGTRQTRSMPASRARSAIRSQQVPMTGAGRERLRRDLEIAALDLRHVENAVDHREQVMSGLADQRRVFVAARLVELHHLLVREHLGEPDDRVERRAQLVAHGGKEAALGGVGALGILARALERLLLTLALGHVADHRDHLALGFGSLALGAIERAAAHLDPDERGRILGARSRALRAGCGTRPSC